MGFDFGINFDMISNFASIIMLAIPLGILQLILMITALVSLLRKPSSLGSDRILWLVIILLVNIIGPILYFAIGSGKLDERAAQLEDEREARGNE